MVGLSMTDSIAAIWLGPPWGSQCITLGIGITTLLLRLNELDKGFGNDLTGELLYILETDIVELFHFLFVANSQLLRLPPKDGHWGIVIEESFSVHCARVA